LSHRTWVREQRPRDQPTTQSLPAAASTAAFTGGKNECCAPGKCRFAIGRRDSGATPQPLIQEIFKAIRAARIMHDLRRADFSPQQCPNTG
jgi:hypothetical protein